MFKPRSRKRRKSPSSSPWKKAKNLLFAKSSALRENSEPESESDSTDWLINPHDTTNGLGSKRRAERKPSGKTPVHIF